MQKQFIDRVKREGFVRTRRYCYSLCEWTYSGKKWTTIDRCPTEHYGTAAAAYTTKIVYISDYEN